MCWIAVAHRPQVVKAKDFGFRRISIIRMASTRDNRVLAALVLRAQTRRPCLDAGPGLPTCPGVFGQWLRGSGCKRTDRPWQPGKSMRAAAGTTCTTQAQGAMHTVRMCAHAHAYYGFRAGSAPTQTTRKCLLSAHWSVSLANTVLPPRASFSSAKKCVALVRSVLRLALATMFALAQGVSARVGDGVVLFPALAN